MPIDIEKIKAKLKELEEKQSSGGEWDYLELKEGDNVVRVLADPEMEDFYVESAYHYLKFGKDKIVMLCRHAVLGEDCYPCDMVESLRKSKDKNDKAMIREIVAKSRYFMNAIDRKSGKVKILAAGPQIFSQILTLIADSDWGDMTDPKDGYDINIKRVGTDRDTEYSVIAKPKRNAVDMEELELWPIADLVSDVPTYEEQEQWIDTGKRPEREEKKSEEPKKPEKKPEKKAEKKPEPRFAEDNKIDELLAKLPDDDPTVAKAIAKWRSKGATLEGLQALVEMFGEEEPPPEEKKALPQKSPRKAATTDAAEDPADDEEVRKALEAYRAGKGGKK
jgi:hypothetical protein